MTKKIIVTGCFNCPFLTVWYNDNSQGLDGISSGSCKHPSISKQLEEIIIDADTFLYYDQQMAGARGARADFHPACPLAND